MLLGKLFSLSFFVVQEGEIWPNMTTQFFIVFKPEEAKLCEQTIYFDITGQQDIHFHISHSTKVLYCITVFHVLVYLSSCVCTGCESRLPLTVVGEAIGPQIQFNYNMVDMRNVFVSDKGSYEVRLVTLKESGFFFFFIQLGLLVS